MFASPGRGAPHHPNLLCILYTMAFIQLPFANSYFITFILQIKLTNNSLIKKPLETHAEALKKIFYYDGDNLYN